MKKKVSLDRAILRVLIWSDLKMSSIPFHVKPTHPVKIFFCFTNCLTTSAYWYYCKDLCVQGKISLQIWLICSIFNSSFSLLITEKYLEQIYHPIFCYFSTYTLFFHSNNSFILCHLVWCLVVSSKISDFTNWTMTMTNWKNFHNIENIECAANQIM